jgi:nitrogen-specific signal transduction histidine kinase/CheY-like chemotaxis protein
MSDHFTVKAPPAGDKSTAPADAGVATPSKMALSRLSEMQRLETIGRLTGGVAHDFNNILTVVIGNTELLLENLPSDDASRHLAEVTLAAARSGADLIRMLLAYSRRQPLLPVEFNANELIEEMLDLLVRSLGAQVKIATSLDGALWGIRADRAQLGSVLLNLTVNARDAMQDASGDGGGTLRIETANVAIDRQGSASAKLPPGDYVSITVSDSGAGIAPEVLKRVFEPFFTTKQAGRGNGLGLSMVQGFVRQSGGQVHIASTQGIGTTISLYLPRAEIQLDLPNIGASDEIRLAREGETVLVVEDNERVRNYVVERLRRLGYGVLAAADGKAALAELAKAGRIDLLFSDIDMPGQDGVKLAERARRLKPGLRILFTSGHPGGERGDGAGDPDKRFRHGYRLLLKPYRKQELARIVRTTLDEFL